MPPVLDEPQIQSTAQDRQPTFARRFAIVVLIAASISCGWYLARKGFRGRTRDRIVEELHRRGVEAQIGRLTLNPFRGLVARNVRIFSYRDRSQTLAFINQIILDINYAAFFYHQPFLNALDIRNAAVTLPLKGPEGKRQQPQLQKFYAHIYFPPEQIFVSQAEGIFCGGRISATGQLIKRNDYKSSDEISDEEWRQRLLLVHRVADELRRFRFSGEGPSLQVKFARDLSQFETIHAEAALSGERLRRGDYEMSNLSVAADWANHTLQIKQCTWSDSIGNFSGRA